MKTDAKVRTGLLLLSVAVASCGGSSSTGSQLDAGTGSGTIQGSVNGNPFDHVTTTLWIGASEGSDTTAVYLFNPAVGCSAITSPGWDTRIANGTQILEVKVFGHTLTTYTVTTSATPAPGEAAINFTLSSTTGTPVETGASGGSASLDALVAGDHTTGKFLLKFGASMLQGTFDAAYCPDGHEP